MFMSTLNVLRLLSDQAAIQHLSNVVDSVSGVVVVRLVLVVVVIGVVVVVVVVVDVVVVVVEVIVVVVVVVVVVGVVEVVDVVVVGSACLFRRLFGGARGNSGANGITGAPGNTAIIGQSDSPEVVKSIGIVADSTVVKCWKPMALIFSLITSGVSSSIIQ